jgi:hypothetical protein
MTTEARERYIGLKLLPVFNTSEKTADYPKITIESLLSVKDTKRAPRAAYNQSDWTFDTDTFNCQDHGWTELLDDEERRLYQYLFDAETVSVERATQIIMMNHEIRSAALLFNTGNFSNTAVSVEWSTPATATPHKDVTITGFNNMKAVGGIKPNVGVCSDTVFRNLVNTAEVKDALKYTDPIEMGGAEAQKRAIAMYFGLKEMFVGDAVKNTAKKGQTAVIGDIWDDEYFMLARVANTQDLKEPQVGRTFLWTTDSPGMLVTESYRVEDNRSDAYRVRHNVDEAIINAASGYLLTNITA